MRILSNFDTGFSRKLYDQYAQTFGTDKVLLVHKSNLFYYGYVAFPFLLWAILFCVALYFVYTKYPDVRRLERVFRWVLGLYFLIMLWKFLRFWINYQMDFLLVTPKEIMKYKQQWLFNRHVEQLRTEHIKSISLSKKWFLHSLLDIGTLTFLVEWQTDSGDIVMEDIDAVEAMQHRITAILWLDSV